jgi:hypothetical protein
MTFRKIFRTILPLATLSLFTGSAGAAKEPGWTRYQDYKIHLDVPKGWQIQRDLFGMPIMVLGPERDGERAVLSVQHTPLRNLRFDHELLSKTRGQYYEGRKQWIRSLDDTGSRYLGGLPMQRLTWANGNDGFEIGFRYRMRGLDFEERSIQISCEKRVFLFKTLLSSKSPESDAKVLAKLVRELDCAETSEQDGPYRPSVLQDLKEKVIAKVNGETPWPKIEQIQNASPEARAAVLEALVEFQKSLEEAGGNDSYVGHSVATGVAYASVREKAKDLGSKIAAWLIQNATAKGGYDCFFGGWPSKFVQLNGRRTCAYPWDQNDQYQKSGTSCAEGELACNPALFGGDVCVSISSAYERNHATSRCEAEFVKKGGNYDQLAQSDDYNKDLLSETYISTESVCKSEPYVSANYGLCSTLAGKLKIALDPPADPNAAIVASGEAYLNGTSEMKPDRLGGQSEAALAGLSDYEARCLNAQGDLNLGDESCLSDTLAVTEDLETLNRNTQLLKDELAAQYAAEADSIIRNENCVDCGVKTGTEVELKPVGCSVAEKKAMDAGKCQWGSLNWYAEQGASCGMNLLTSVVSSLWDTVKAIGGLAWDGVKWVGKKVTDGLVSAGKWFAGLFGYEDQSSKKVNVASQVSDSFLKELIAHPIDTVMKMFSAIWDGVQRYLDYDAYCQKWSGVPHFSTCLVPGTDNCVSCSMQFSGACSVIGYVIGEVLPAIFTGGASAAASGAALSAKIVGSLGKAAKAGKMATVLKKVKRVSNVVRNSKVGKMGNTIGKKKAQVARWSDSKVKKLTDQLARAEKTLSKYKSPRFGNYRNTLGVLQSLRKRYFVVKAGVWTVKWAVVKPARAAVRLTKAVVKAPVTVPKAVVQRTLKVQEAAFNFGAKYGEKYGNRVLRKTMDRALSNPSHWGRTQIQAQKAIEAGALRLSGSAPLKVSNSIRWFGTRANLIGNIYQGKNVLDESVQIDWTNQETIRRIALTEGRSEEEVRQSLRVERMNRLTVEGVYQALKSGTEPSEADFKRVEGFTGKTRDELRLESIEERVAGASLDRRPVFSTADYAVFAASNSLTPEQGRRTLDNLVEGRVLEESVMDTWNAGREPDPESVSRLVEIMNETTGGVEGGVTADVLRVTSITNRLTGVNGLKPVFTQKDYEAWSRMNKVSVDEARIQIQQSVESMVNPEGNP